MSRGDQRDRDRQKSQAKLAAKQKQQGRCGDPNARNANDAAALQAKIAAKKAQKESAANQGTPSKGPIPRKKVAKKEANVDDLLSAGLASGKKNKRAK